MIKKLSLLALGSVALLSCSKSNVETPNYKYFEVIKNTLTIPVQVQLSAQPSSITYNPNTFTLGSKKTLQPNDTIHFLSLIPTITNITRESVVAYPRYRFYMYDNDKHKIDSSYCNTGTTACDKNGVSFFNETRWTQTLVGKDTILITYNIKADDLAEATILTPIP